MESLKAIDGVTVDISEEKKSLTISYKTERSLDFHFKWVDDNHFVGYFEDAEGEKSHAVVAIWTPMDAI